MKIVQAGFEIMDPLNGEEILRKIERVARVCYKSEDKITTGSAEKMVRGLIKRGHEAMLEHFSFSVKFTVDRGVSHELVRHRIASFAQEARAVLPNSLKTEIVVTANLREWRNIFKLRAVGVTGKPHPQMLEVMVPLLEEVKKQIPVVFDDLVIE